MEAVDPQTGERYTEKDVLANANSFMSVIQYVHRC